MAKVRSWVGLDVPAAKVVACVVDAESGEMTVVRMGGETAVVVAACAALPGPTRVARRPSLIGERLRRRGSGVWSRRRGRSSARHRIGSRLISATRSGWCSC